MSESIYQPTYNSVVVHLAHFVDKTMIEDTKEGYQHDSTATYDICRAQVDSFIEHIQRDEEDLAELLYQHYYSTFIKPHLSNNPEGGQQ